MDPVMKNITQEKIAELKEAKRKENVYIGNQTVGCLAMVNFGNGSGIKRVWQ